MLLNEIIKYKPRHGKPYRVKSISIALRNARLAKRVARDYQLQAGIALVGIHNAMCLGSMESKKLEALKKSMATVAEEFRNRRHKS